MKKQNRVAFFNILSTLLLRGISIFTSPLFSRLLGTSGYGVTSVYNIWTSAAAIVLPLQTQGTLVNARVEYPQEDQEKYQSSVMALSVLSFAVIGGLLLLFIRPVSSRLQLHWILIPMMLLQAFGIFATSFVGSKFTYEFKAGRNFAMSMGLTLTNFLLSLVLVLTFPKEHNYFGRILALVLTYGGIGIPCCIYILRRGRTFYNREYWTFCLTLALPVIFHNLSDLILGQSDRVMLQHMLGDSIVGQYSLAYTFGNVMFTIFQALNNSWCPFFFEDMKNARLGQVKQQAKYFLELFTVLSVGFVLLTNEVFHVYARQDFWAGTSLIPIFVASYYLNFLCTFPVNFEYYHKKTKVVAVVTITSSLINIVLNFFFIRHIGMAGAALATMISHGFQLTMHHAYCRYSLGKGTYPFGIRLWAKYAAAFFCMVVFVTATEEMAVLRWGLGICIGIWELLRIKKRKVLI